MENLKHKIAMYCKRKNIENSVLFKLAVKINFFIFHKKKQMKKQYQGGNRNVDKKFYVILGNGKEVGLCSHFITVMNEVYYAVNNGYIPVVDFRNDRTQYNMPYLVNGTWNAWEYYFEQVSSYTLEEVEESQNVVFSWGNNEYEKLIDSIDYSEQSIQKVKKWIKKYLVIKEEIISIVNQKKEELFGGEKILGVFCRGTDYVALKPKGHPIQPNVEQVISKTREYLKTYPNIKKIFLATEDYEIYRKFQDVFGEMVCVSDLELVKNYDGKDYLCNYLSKDRYETGKNYLIKMLLLAECNYFIASKASGSYFVMTMKEKAWEDKFIYEMGIY